MTTTAAGAAFIRYARAQQAAIAAFFARDDAASATAIQHECPPPAAWEVPGFDWVDTPQPAPGIEFIAADVDDVGPHYLVRLTPDAAGLLLEAAARHQADPATFWSGARA